MTHLISCLTFLVFGVLVMQVAGVTKEEIETYCYRRESDFR